MSYRDGDGATDGLLFVRAVGENEVNPNSRRGILARQDHGIPCEGLWGYQRRQREIVGECDEVGESIHIDTECHVDISGQARLTIEQDRLTANDHVGNLCPIEGDCKLLKQLCEH